MQLHQPEFLISRVFQDLAEQFNFMVHRAEVLDGADQGSGPVDDQLLEAVALIQERVHVLFHGLSGLLLRYALFVTLVFRQE